MKGVPNFELFLLSTASLDHSVLTGRDESEGALLFFILHTRSKTRVDRCRRLHSACELFTRTSGRFEAREKLFFAFRPFFALPQLSLTRAHFAMRVGGWSTDGQEPGRGVSVNEEC